MKDSIGRRGLSNQSWETMVFGNRKSTSWFQDLAQGHEKILYLRVVLKTTLTPLPASIAPHSRLNRCNEEPGEQQTNGRPDNEEERTGKADRAIEAFLEASKQMAEFTATMMQLDAAREERHAEEVRSMRETNKQVGDFLASFMKAEAAREERRTRKRNIDLELQLAPAESPGQYFNWMFGDGVAPTLPGQKASKSQRTYHRVKSTVRAAASHIMFDATDEELLPPFIQFDDTPRAAVTGQYIKQLLLGLVDTDELMALALVRILRRDEALRNRVPVTQGECYYVIHRWAQKVLAGDPDVEECEEIFKQPTSTFTFAACNKVVAFMYTVDGWASVSIDFNLAATHIIHPPLSSAPPTMVLEKYINSMVALTAMAQAHMKKLGRIRIPEQDWMFDVALKEGQPMQPHASGIATAFYSIPKDGQFIVASHETISLAAFTFVYDLRKMCLAATKKSITKGNGRKIPKPRHTNGKFKAQKKDLFSHPRPSRAPEESLDRSDDESEAQTETASQTG